MGPAKRRRLAAKGWALGDAKAFLGLSDEEAAVIDLELALADSRRQSSSGDSTNEEIPR